MAPNAQNLECFNGFTAIVFTCIWISDKAESILRRAQRAILNPNIDVEVFRTEDSSTLPPGDELMFSEDTVIAEIVGMDMDITFMDLPGLISSVSTCMKYLTP
jgi:hypothetical protein